MYSMQYIGGHIQVYDACGKFLFSADTQAEVWEEMTQYAKYTP